MSVFRWRPARERRSTSLFGQAGSPWITSGRSYANAAPSTVEGALQVIAVRSSVDLLASLASELPIDIYSGRGAGKQTRSVPGYLDDPAGDGYGREDWAYQLVQSWLLRGNAYGETLSRGPGNIPTQVELFHPDRVSGTMVDGAPSWSVNGRHIDSKNFVHTRANPMSGQILGLSPVGLHMTDLGLSTAMSQFGLQYFQDGAMPQSMLTNDLVDLNDGQRNQVKKAFVAALNGSREPVVMGKGWKFETLTVNPEESQFLESRGFTSAECCRIFGPGVAELLGYDSGGSMTYANVDSRLLHLLILSLGKWLNRLDRVYSSMLPRPQWARLNRGAILETTTMQRYLAHASALGAGWKVPDEVRALEDMAPLPNGLGELPTKTQAPAAPAADPNPSDPKAGQ